MNEKIHADIQALQSKIDFYREIGKTYREQADAALANADYLMQVFNASNAKEDYDACVTCSDRVTELESRADTLEKAVDALADAIEALTEFQ